MLTFVLGFIAGVVVAGVVLAIVVGASILSSIDDLSNAMEGE